MTGHRFYLRHHGVRIAPIQSKEVLYSADEIVRLGERQFLQIVDWGFLSPLLLVLNQNWPRIRRRATSTPKPETAKRWVPN